MMRRPGPFSSCARLTVMVAAALLLTVSAVAADVVPHTRFLVPLFTPRTQGAFGSIWETDTWVYYGGTGLPDIYPRPNCYFILCPAGGALDPGVSPVPVHHRFGFEESGALFHVESTLADEVRFASRFRDTSRSAQSAGTEIPVVREDRILNAPVRLVNVPIASHLRAMLRVYALPEVVDGEVEIRFYRLWNPGDSSFEDAIVLRRAQRVRLRALPATSVFETRPTFASVADLQSIPELAADERVWIEVIPLALPVAHCLLQ